MNTLPTDGASENRAAFKKLATLTARSIFLGYCNDDDLEGLPFKVAFPHPSPVYSKDITIFIGGEMPHWVKKVRNAFDSKAQKLEFRGKWMSLAMCDDVWKQTTDASMQKGNLRKYKFGKEHFQLNSYNKMQVFLAMQIFSQTMIRMLTVHCDSTDANIGDYDPMMEIFNAVDWLIDIMNATSFKNGKHTQVRHINSPVHPNIFELFAILRLFEEWKEEAGGFNEKYITKYTYEDLVWMVFGLAGVAYCYLDVDGSKKCINVAAALMFVNIFL